MISQCIFTVSYPSLISNDPPALPSPGLQLQLQLTFGKSVSLYPPHFWTSQPTCGQCSPSTPIHLTFSHYSNQSSSVVGLIYPPLDANSINRCGRSFPTYTTLGINPQPSNEQFIYSHLTFGIGQGSSKLSLPSPSSSRTSTCPKGTTTRRAKS